MRYFTMLLIVAGLLWVVLPEKHSYELRRIDTPQSDGTVAHDYVRIDLTAGTMCAIHGTFWYNDAFVHVCESGE